MKGCPESRDLPDSCDSPDSKGEIDPLDRNPPEPALLRRASEEPDVLLGEVFDVHHDTFWHLVTFRMDGRLMSRIDADDVLQDAYLAAKIRIEHWVQHPKHSLFVWTRMTVMQTLIDVHRRHLEAGKRSAGREISIGGARLPNTTAESLAGILAASQTSPSGRAIREESSAELQRAIETMSEIDQEMIALRHFEGLNNQQAAEVLGLSATAASNRYIRALSRLQAVLETK
ncbi:sigma-70 family RNA polymerase sigma factor [Neorhodopirellula pilleata]|uniref:RNA polymerase sigma factor n=1 Tax=Neorhodopirellula pilleata TaxID=2714738 RepID=A0A5C6AR16_9BACT|nr:sigma-70 family RNA polymerase sigma factor [Neorhodopirellula pilleata]TWU01937.1 RNA polymerase sigma factor [Neorhodopirellula pilleata]